MPGILSTHGLRCAAVMLLCCLTTGCAELHRWRQNHFKVGPNYCKPVAPIADEWIDFNDPAVISDELGVNETAWWRLLGDPLLEDLVTTAYAQNLPLRAAGMRVLEAQAQRAIAAGQLLPQLQEGFGSFNRTQFSAVGNPIGIPILPRTIDQWSTGFNVGWELDIWGRFRRNLESADANVDVAVEDYDDILVCLIAETAAAYVELRGFEQRLDYARRNRDLQRDNLRIAEVQLRAGSEDKLIVTQTASVLAQTEALIPTLEQGRREANNRLCVLLGQPPRDLTPELATAPIPTAPKEVVVGIPAELLRRRPDVRRAEREVARQSALIGVATADLFPAFSIDGQISWQANEFADLFNSAANAGFINPGFNWNLLNYGRIQNNILAQDARFQELAIAYQETALQANAEAENAITRFQKAHDRVQALRDGVEAAEESVRVVNSQFEGGTVNATALFVTQQDLVIQQDAYAEALTEVALSLIRVYKTLGGGWQLRYGQLPPAELPAPTDAPAEQGEAELVTPPMPEGEEL